MNFAGFGSYLSGSQKVWYIDTDGGKLVGLQFSANGLYAWTGWTGSAGMNAYDDIGKYTNGALLSSDLPSGDFTVNFVVARLLLYHIMIHRFHCHTQSMQRL